MTGTIGIDTTLLIDFFKGETKAVKFVEKNNHLFQICEIVVYEFLCGNITKKEKEIFLEAIKSIQKSEFNREATIKASEIYREGRRTGKIVGHQDCLIAGIYKANGIKKIVTRNKKHFKKMKGIKVIEY